MFHKSNWIHRFLNTIGKQRFLKLNNIHDLVRDIIGGVNKTKSVELPNFPLSVGRGIVSILDL